MDNFKMRSIRLTSLACLAALASLLAAGSLQAQKAPANPLGLSFHHATVSVADIEKESRWYERVFGFQRGPLISSGNFKSYQMTMPSVRIDLIWQKGSTRPPTRPVLDQGWRHIVFNVKNFDSTLQYLQKVDTDVKIFRDRSGKIEHLEVYDPEGNEIGIAND